MNAKLGGVGRTTVCGVEQRVATDDKFICRYPWTHILSILQTQSIPRINHFPKSSPSPTLHNPLPPSAPPFNPSHWNLIRQTHPFLICYYSIYQPGLSKCRCFWKCRTVNSNISAFSSFVCFGWCTSAVFPLPFLVDSNISAFSMAKL